MPGSNKNEHDDSSRELELRIEQERTKQLQFRLENTQKTIELLQLTAKLGLQPSDLTSLLTLTGGTSSSGNSASTTATAPPQFKFPPNNRSASPTRNRVHSPARIGAQTVASLAHHPDNSTALNATVPEANVTIKEEPTSPKSQVKLATFHSYTASANIPPVSAKHIGHSRNMSLPTLNRFPQDSQSIPPAMTSILSFNNVAANSSSSSNNSGNTDMEKPQPGHPGKIKLLDSGAAITASPTQWRTHKKHRRAKSASGFGVIDLNVVDEAKRKAIITSILSTAKPLPPLQPMPRNTDTHTVPALAQPLKPNTVKPVPREDFDERTCSETSSSSRCESPVHYRHAKTHAANSVQQLLND